MPGVRGRTRTSDADCPGRLSCCAAALRRESVGAAGCLLADLFPDSRHIRALRGFGAPDLTVWQLAAEQGCILVTKDEDFQRLSISRGAPPKVIWVRLGNCTALEVAQLLRSRVAVIQGFEAHEEATFLALA